MASNGDSPRYVASDVCGVCSKEGEGDDTQDWVQCDKCDQWFHFLCVGVDSNVAASSWVCNRCTQAAVIAIVSATTQPTQTHTTAASKAPRGSLENRQRESTGKITARHLRASGTETHAHALNSTSAEMESLKLSEIAEQTKGHEIHTFASEQLVTTQVNSTQAELMLAMLDEERKAEKIYFEKKYALISQMGGSDQTAFIRSSKIQPPTPTPTQIAARQAIPRDLPIFGGDPEEWPMFISTYESSTSIAGFTEVENMLRLQKSLKGKARELVKDKLLVPSQVDEVVKTLRTFFGRPEHILERLIDKVRKMAPPKDRLESLIEFALGVRNICATMESCNMRAHLENPLLVKELVDKLSNQHKLCWAMQKKDDSVPAMKAFSDWMYQMAEAASTVVSPIGVKTNPVNAHTEAKEKQTDFITCKICKGTDHRVAACNKFKNLTLDEKWKAIKEQNLCRQCLKSHKGRCFSQKECGINGCTSKHNQLLHRSQTEEGAQSTHGVVSAHQSTHAQASRFFRIVPVKLYSKSKCIEIFAFLDEGSSVTLVDQRIFKELKLKGISDPLCLQWTNNTMRTESKSIRTSVKISAANSERQFWLNNVRTVENLSLPTQSIDSTVLKDKYNHLAGLPIPSYADAAPLILIGADNWKLAVPRKLHEGGWRDPIATKCLLGWAVQGGNVNTSSSYLNVHSCSCNYDELHEAVKNSFNLDPVAPRYMTSKDEAKAIKTLENNCIKKNGQYEVGLLWQRDDIQLPESYDNAVKRSMCLKRKMQNDSVLKATLQERIDNLVAKGYAREITDEEKELQSDRIWYLPIFITTNPNKANKVRLVWDGAATSNGKSLNDFLLTGPDLLTPLNNVLMGFRVGKVAVCGDIAEMFHRINISESDMHAQRFLWWNDFSESQPKIFVMRAMTFGIRCAPCIAHYVRNKNAAEFTDTHSRAVDAIQNAHYVDDFIDSCENIEEAIQLANEVREIHAKGGFTIRNWASNSVEVLQSLQENCKSTQAPLNLFDTEKVLGMYWDPNKDVFKFIFRFTRLKRDVLRTETMPTKREALQVLMSIFDPLGFLAPFTIELKILLQRVWQDECGWDDEIPTALHRTWNQWKTSLQHVAEIEIPRCYSHSWAEATSVDLHTFVDASENAYAACCYLRIQSADSVTISLVASKSKVAPLKPLSIPRLELQAAVIGVRLAQTVAKTRNININEYFYWSDSKTVLRWIRMNPRGFQQFVMHRVGEILESTKVNQWRWVPTKSNVADVATKVTTNIDKRTWLEGPSFLKEGNHAWPSCTDLGPVDQAEIRKHVLNIHQEHVDLFNAEYFSDWKRLYRAVATFIWYIEKLKASIRNVPKAHNLTYEMITNAKKSLLKEAQKSAFSVEIKSLKNGQFVNKSSILCALNVYLDKDTIMRVQGRAQNPNSEKDPVVLPGHSHITQLIVKAVHENFHHISHETAINIIRTKYYIPKLRILYKKIRKNCQRCKIDLARPDIPQMAPIPRARLASFERPFTYTGVDYFGPLSVSVGRRKEKRWGVLYTCLTLRAVHIEIAHSLDTSSCIMSLRNFIARRGTPREIFSDNGTNFKATAKIICDELRNVDFSTLEAKFDSIKWRFNPPSAPHMGGAWERLVRSVKTVLLKMCPNKNFHDESLRNALCEVELVLNSRPLTFVTMESSDEEALTPNHLLLGSADGHKVICASGSDLRLRWQQTQTFADQFWQRWVREYAPNLIRRGKWHEKRPPIRIGDVVVVVDEALPRNCWPKGIITEVVVAKDGQVRRATVKTQHGTFIRPTAKLAVLDVGAIESRLSEPGFVCGGENVAAK